MVGPGPSHWRTGTCTHSTGYDKALRAYCREHGIVYQNYWTLSANPQLKTHPTLRGIASRHARTPEQTLFRYRTQCVVVPLTGTRSEQHMREALAILEFELEREEQRRITGLLD